MTESRDFEAESAHWDESAARRHIADAVARCILAHGRLWRTDRLVDLGCGTGLVTLALAGSVRSVLAVDSAQGMIDRLQAKLSASHISNVRVLREEVAAMTQAPGAFDVVVCTQTLSHVPSLSTFLEKAHQLLAPGGRLLVSEMELVSPGRAVGGRDREGLAGLLRACGFERVESWTAAEVPSSTAETRVYYLCAAWRS